ncbi:hypothetical protein WISP_142411 [Willisornis vidua]|uniref:Uncharacterized protein n=1 Tax=Willisornis vidua TaxID=1566151 RepID=A0ABQ9CSD3_9PASS|nr:hypothetical protein WISP_142411 [Willisornis vidua]
MEVHGGAEIHPQPLEEYLMEQVDVQRRLGSRGKPVLELGPVRTCRPMEKGAHTGAGLMAGLVTPRGTHTGALFLTDCAPRKGPTLEQFVKNCSPWEALMLEKFMRNCLP